MIYWIKKIARIIAFLSFFIIFFCGIDLKDPFHIYTVSIAFIKALCGAILLWFACFVICDIVLKGIVEDIPDADLEKLDGGIIQRIHGSKEESTIKEKTEEEQTKSVETKEK